MPTPSAILYERGCRVMPGGVSRNTVLRSPHPIYAKRGRGCRVTDIEGITRLDFANNMCSLLHGHAHPVIIEAVSAQLHKGTAFTATTEIELEFAEHLCTRSTSFEKIRFVNSGTEAVMGCLKAARAYTGRSKIAKAEGAYHGLYDFAEISQTAKPENWGESTRPRSVPVAYGTPKGVLDDVVVIPFNDIEGTISILDHHKEELACVLIDPLPHRIGLAPATSDYIRALRKWTTDNSALLIYDEVITYRFSYGGCQEFYPENPDLTAMGKGIGGGFPVGALAGRTEVMDVMDPHQEPLLFPHSGTFSANPMTMTAGFTAMTLFDQSCIERLNSLGERARNNIREAIQLSGFNACVSGVGSMFRVHLKEQVPKNFRQTYLNEAESKVMKLLLEQLFDNGIMLINTCTGALSSVMAEDEIDRLGEVMLKSFRTVRGEQP